MKELELRIASYFGVQLDLGCVDCNAANYMKIQRVQFIDTGAKDVQRDTEIKDESGGEQEQGDRERISLFQFLARST